MILIRLEVSVDRGSIVQHLDFHSHIGGIPFERSMDADPIVRAGRELELKTEVKILIFLFRIKISMMSAFWPHYDGSVLHDIIGFVSYPTVQVFPIEQGMEAFCFFFW